MARKRRKQADPDWAEESEDNEEEEEEVLARPMKHKRVRHGAAAAPRETGEIVQRPENAARPARIPHKARQRARVVREPLPQQLVIVDPGLKAKAAVAQRTAPAGIHHPARRMLPGLLCGQPRCLLKQEAQRFLQTLGVHPQYLDPRHDRCYCTRCYKSEWPDTISNEGPTKYVVPRGWYRFGLRVPSRATGLVLFSVRQ